MSWRPLSLRGATDQRFDEPAEGIPIWLRDPLLGWVSRSFIERGPDGETSRIRVDAIEDLQLWFRLEEPFRGPNSPAILRNLESRIADDQVFGLDVIDWMLSNWGWFHFSKTEARQWSRRLGQLLANGGSAWEVTPADDAYQLTRRATGPVVEVLEATSQASTRAHHHLLTGWAKLMGRNPDPSGAYREALRAVEAVAKPIVLPDDGRATLGLMIAALRDKPEKWQTVIGTVDDVRSQMAAVWKGQLDRHGTDDEEVPLNVSSEEADAAFSICLNLVRQFVGGHVYRV